MRRSLMILFVFKIDYKIQLSDCQIAVFYWFRLSFICSIINKTEKE